MHSIQGAAGVMRFPGFSTPSKAPSFRLGTPLGEQKVTVTVASGAVWLKTRGGEVGAQRRSAALPNASMSSYCYRSCRA